MLPEHSEFARFTAHRRMPHMRGVHRNDEIYAVVPLEDCKFFTLAAMKLLEALCNERAVAQDSTRG